MISKQAISEISKRIVRTCSADKVYVFGSYAQGQPRTESDLDICVITNLGRQRKIEVIRKIRREITSSFHFPVDILVYDTDEFEERSKIKSSFEYHIVQHGLLINE